MVSRYSIREMIYVFKTSVKSQKDINRLRPYLEASLGQSHWNFDLDDCDNIFRVESEKENEVEIIRILWDLGFDCEELPD